MIQPPQTGMEIPTTFIGIALVGLEVFAGYATAERDRIRKEAREEATLNGELRRAIHTCQLSLSTIANRASTKSRAGTARSNRWNRP